MKSEEEKTWIIAAKALSNDDLGAAREIVQQAADRGDWLAYCELAHLYEMSNARVAPDLTKALYWYRKSLFESDDPNAHLGLARLLVRGEVKQCDYEQARIHLEKALQSGGLVTLNERYRIHAYIMLADMHEKGMGVPKNKAKSDEYLQQAVAEGYAWPLFILASRSLRAGKVWEWMKIRLAAARKVLELVNSNPDDPRLTGCRTKKSSEPKR